MKKMVASLMGVVAAVTLGTAAFAAEQVNYHIIVEKPDVQNVVYRRFADVTGNTLKLSFVNNTDRALFFETNGEKTFIPLSTEWTVETAHAPGQVYTLLDENGQVFYKWQVSDAKWTYSLDANTVAQHEKWASTLAQVLAAQRVVYQPEESRQDRSSSPAVDRNVRGYW
jgi:hypothetical protein